ncbi:MAG: pyrroline-5-carboxylate reductase [Phycisphaerales bacterium]|nr:pyrroline-5-carboxylate reductase [Phycisphaerales bacterium]
MSAVPIGVIGGGTMAYAILRGALEAGVVATPSIAVAEPESGKRDMFRALGIRAHKHGPDLVQWLLQVEPGAGQGVLLLAVKPQALAEVARELAPLLPPARRLVYTILAGTPTARVRSLLGQQTAIVRLMPNTPIAVRRGTTAVAVGDGAREGDEALAFEVFGALGRVVRIDEGLMDAFTAVAGSGPAYLFYLAEAMTRAAREVGFDADTAEWIVRWTLGGAAALLDAADQPPATLRAAVTSKGGTTAAAAQVLDAGAVMETFVRAVRAARDRGQELSGEGQSSREVN